MYGGWCSWGAGALAVAAAGACTPTANGTAGVDPAPGAGSPSGAGRAGSASAATSGAAALGGAASGGAAGATALGGSADAGAGAGQGGGDAGQGGAGASLGVELYVIQPLAKHVQQALTLSGTTRTDVVAASPDGTHVLALSTFVESNPNGPGEGRFEELVMWTPETGSVSLGSLGNADAEAQYSVHSYTEDLSSIVGVVRRVDQVDRAFSWRPGAAMKELVLPVAPDILGLTLSRDGQVALASAHDVDGKSRLFRFDADGRTEISPLPGFESIDSTYVSPDGATIIGYGRTLQSCETDCWQNFVWQAGTGTKQLALPEGAQACSLTGYAPVGGLRIAVKCAVDPSTKEGFVWAEGPGWLKVGGLIGSSTPRYLSRDAKSAFGVGWDSATSTDVMWRWGSGAGTELLVLPQNGKVNELLAVVAATADGRTVLAESRTPVRVVLWTPEAPVVLPLLTGMSAAGAESMTEDGRIITGYASGSAGSAVLWVDREPLLLDAVFKAAGVDLTGIQLDRPIVSSDGHSMSGSATVQGAPRGWLAHLSWHI